MKVCAVCQVEKSLDEFYRSKRSPDGRKPDCIPCRKAAVRTYTEANRDLVRERARARPRKRNLDREREQERKRRATPEGRLRAREQRLKAQYGISTAEYDRLTVAQGGVCAICKRPPSDRNTKSAVLYVDHDHATKAVRGLLCNTCNTGLGHFQDDRNRLLAAIRYLMPPA